MINIRTSGITTGYDKLKQIFLVTTHNSTTACTGNEFEYIFEMHSVLKARQNVVSCYFLSLLLVCFPIFHSGLFQMMLLQLHVHDVRLSLFHSPSYDLKRVTLCLNYF